MKKLFFLLGALLYYCGVEAQNVQSIGDNVTGLYNQLKDGGSTE